MKWTLEQLEAIDKEGSNIIVSAGAGSGKTAVLSQRVLRKVKSGIDIRNILILTFTNEAAGEMKNRIRKKLVEANLKEQLEYIDAAYITTFDAYALSIVKKYHYLLNITPNVTIIDSSLIDLKKVTFIDEIFEELYNQKDPQFLKLIGDFTSRDDQSIKDAILSINSSLDLKYDKASYLQEYVSNFYQKDYIDSLFKEYFAYLKNLSSLIENTVYTLENYVDEKTYLKLYEAYSPLFNPKTYNDLFKVKTIPVIQLKNLEEEALIYKENLKKYKEELLSLNVYSEAELKEQILSTKDYVEAIIKVILKLDARLEAYKNEHESYEFTDIAKKAIEIVQKNASICTELKNSYNEILIDEYQDTNDLQEMFISQIENNNVYMVGDIKQSIYRFRNANPSIFKTKYECYSQNKGGIKIDLLKNFRSRKEVLANINEIFNLIMTEEYGSVNYQNNHAMVYGNLAYINEGANSYNNNMEILKYHNDTKEYKNAEVEAFAIARDIKNKLEESYLVFDFDLKANRKATYQDFCIILDRGSDMPLYKKIFEYLNIPLVVYKDSDLVSAHDLLIIKNIITFILCIHNRDYTSEFRYAFTSIARSFLINLSDAEIFQILTNNEIFTTDIYHICANIAESIPLKTPHSLLHEIIESFKYYENLIKVGDVNSAITRLEYILDLAKSMESLGLTIKEFQEYLDEMITNKKEIRYKDNQKGGDCVKIMNIHKSKGLEFPICYFAGFKKDFNLRDLQSRFMFDNKYGILTPFYKEGIGTLLTKTLIKNKYYQDEISEKIRLFYVALTRAKEKMIMVMPDFKIEHQALNQVEALEAMNYRSFYDFINSISLNLKAYMRSFSLNDLSLTKNYEYVTLNSNIELEKDQAATITFFKNELSSSVLENKHASKTITSLLNKEEARTLMYGTSLHEMLEQTNFLEPASNTYVKNLQNTFDFSSCDIYQEFEFIYESAGTEYHGIIDLMLEYPAEIKIIDYKLKNIEDDHYLNQLLVYYNYIKTISSKKVSLYLYSLMDNKIKEINPPALKVSSN